MNSHRIHHRHRQQVDVNQVGTIGRNQFQQWVHAGVGSTGQSSEGGVTAVTFLMLMLILILALMLQQLVKVLVSTLTPIQILFVDQAVGGIQTYTQNIKVRFLQTPLIPSPGPPILHERPPQPPVAQTSQIVIRNLPASPEPPRSVIIERISATPYQPLVIQRKTIVRRVDVDKEYSKPRNIIIQYEHLQVRVVRQFQRYGAQLLDAQILLQQVRAAGVVEDIVIGLSSSFSNLLGGSGFTGVGFDNSLLEGTGATVNSADKNKDDIIAGNEFKQFYQSGLLKMAIF
ncbi:unnamed protein product [Rotaria magnacalcarata]